MFVPFPKDAQLNEQLELAGPGTSSSCYLIRIDEAKSQCLPGRPRTLLHANDLHLQLKRDLHTPDLDLLAPHLWLVATQSSSHINPLHKHVVKGCDIVITENPELHLTWTDNRIFIKPLPPYLLSHALWATQLAESPSNHSDEQDPPTDPILKAALGFMRTYYHLIQHESDLHLARQARLIPTANTNNNITLEDFHAFIAGFGSIPDDHVSPRYANSGTLRLSRLNIWSKIFLRRFQFYHINRQYGEYFARFYAPILFFLAVLTVVLGAMQVGLQVNGSDGGGAGSAEQRQHPSVVLEKASLWFSIATLLCLCGIGLVLALLFVFMLVREVVFAIKGVIRRRRRYVVIASRYEKGFFP